MDYYKVYTACEELANWYMNLFIELSIQQI